MDLIVPVEKLLFITERFPPDLGGVASSSRRIASALADGGIEVHVFGWTKTLQPGQLITEEFEVSNGKVINVHRLGLFGNFDFSLQYTFNILEWLHQQNHFDAVWGHYVYPSGFAAVTFAELQKLPSTVSARGNDIDRLMFPPGDFARLTWTLERATAISAVSKEIANKIDMILGSENRTMILPNVVDVETFKVPDESKVRSLRNERGYLTDEKVIGFCGELRQKKGFPFLLDTFRFLNEGDSVRLLIIGEVRTQEQNQLAEFLEDNPHLKEKLSVTGRVLEPFKVAEHLMVCDAIVSPSLWDGVPNSILEAMACGCLVIASDAGGIPEIVAHRENGILVSKHSLFEFGKAVGDALRLPDEQKKRIKVAARMYCESLREDQVQTVAINEILGKLSVTKSKIGFGEIR